MCHLRHRWRIFSFHRKAMFCSQNIQVFVFLTIPWFSKSVNSWCVLVNETGCIFQHIFWTRTHKVIKLGQLVDINKDNNFQVSFEQFGWCEDSSVLLLVFLSQTCSKYLLCSTLVFDQISFWYYLRFKRNKHKHNFCYVWMPLITS